MNIHIITLLAGLSLPTILSAAPGSDLPPMEHPFIMSLNIGPNINTGGNTNNDIFGQRPDVCTQFDIRLHYPLSHGWSAYFDLGLSFFTMKADNLVEGFGTALLNLLAPGFGTIHTNTTVGASYLFQHSRFILIPRAGFGWYHVKKGTGKPFKSDGSSVTIDRNITTPTFNPGISVGYRTSRVCSLMLDLAYRCPLRAATSTVTTTSNNRNTSVTKYTSRSWGNDLTISAGIQFQMEL